MQQVLEELVVSRGKRTKRQRLPSPLRLAMPCNNAGTTSSYYNNNNDVENLGVDLSMSITTNSSPTTTTIDQLRDHRAEEEEEEDMANCLILLARGHHHTPVPPLHHNNNNNSGLYVNYQCKTCNRCFPSSQALGGHRASHSKLYKANGSRGNGIVTEEKQAVTTNYDHGDPTTNTVLSLQIPNRSAMFSATTASATTTRKSNKVHECSVCGAEFSSGQALGGHMRRHRTLVSTSTTTTTSVSMGAGGGSPKSSQEANKKPRNVNLKLDLNLPAADPDQDEQRESKFSFQPSRDNVIAFSRSSLVDCHY